MVAKPIELLRRNRLATEGYKVVSDLIEIAYKEDRSWEEFMASLEKNLLKTGLMRLVADAVSILKFDLNRKVDISQATLDYEQKLALSSCSPGDAFSVVMFLAKGIMSGSLSESALQGMSGTLTVDKLANRAEAFQIIRNSVAVPAAAKALVAAGISDPLSSAAAPIARIHGAGEEKCGRCQGTGHVWSDCPANTKAGPNVRLCGACHQPGHFAKDCKHTRGPQGKKRPPKPAGNMRPKKAKWNKWQRQGNTQATPANTHVPVPAPSAAN
eukprot:jgi/Mesvir1/20363/Mv25869-RA.1